MTDYSTSKIYKIICNITQETYIGSTITPLKHRLCQHISDAKHKSQVCASKHIIDRGDFKIELIEDFPCETKQDLLFRERYWIENMDCINKVRPINTTEETALLKKTIRDIHNKKHTEQPPIQCECGGTYTYKHKARHMNTLEHRLATEPEFKRQHDEETAKRKEEQAQRKKEYKAQYAKDHLHQYRENYANTEKVQCECGHTYHPRQQKIHLQSTIHRSVMDAEFKAELQAKQEASRIKDRERKTRWEREKRAKLKENKNKQT